VELHHLFYVYVILFFYLFQFNSFLNYIYFNFNLLYFTVIFVFLVHFNIWQINSFFNVSYFNGELLYIVILNTSKSATISAELYHLFYFILFYIVLIFLKIYFNLIPF